MVYYLAMFKAKRITLSSEPKPKPPPPPPGEASSSTPDSAATAGHSSKTTIFTTTTASSSSSSSSDSLGSIASLRNSLREAGPTFFPLAELAAATGGFRSPSPSWRCSLRGLDASVLRRRFRRDPAALPARLAAACRSHHSSVARLLGAALSPDVAHLYLVYAHAPGATLARCLRNPKNPSFTPLATWAARMLVAADLAQGLEYIHRHSAAGAAHGRLDSSTVVVTEPGLRAKICHFAATELAGEDGTRVEGMRGYMAPEVTAGGRPTRESDVFSLGVALLELVSGEEPLRYEYKKGRGECEVVSLIETAREAVGSAEGEERRGRVRRWVDGRLRDSFPVGVAERAVRVALRCVEADAAARPDAEWVAGKVSRLLLESKAWEERVGCTTDVSFSLAPR